MESIWNMGDCKDLTWVALQQSHTLPREDKIKHILSRIKSCLRQRGQHDIPKLVKLTELWFLRLETIKCLEGMGGTAAESYPTKVGQNKAHSEQD